MHASFGIGEALALVVLAGLAVSYVWGWRRLHRAMPTLATPVRLLAFVVALSALALVLVWPLPGWSNYLLAMRSLQKALICMIACPLLWLSAPVHVIAWGMRDWRRRGWLKLDAQGWSRQLMHTTMHTVTQPLVTWFIYVSVFLFWHDPSVAKFLLGDTWAHAVAPWLLLCAGLLFWWPIVDAGPRFHRRFPTWLLIVYLVTVEAANMIAGITIAFSSEPLYPYYPAVRAQLAADALPFSEFADQVLGGAIVWVFGSFVYITGIIFVLRHLFIKEGSNTPQPLPNWDDNEKFIAPGLEYRVAQNQLRNTDLSHH
jgi:cytochrome c oxidase assembly factor CtaG